MADPIPSKVIFSFHVNTKYLDLSTISNYDLYSFAYEVKTVKVIEIYNLCVTFIHQQHKKDFNNNFCFLFVIGIGSITITFNVSCSVFIDHFVINFVSVDKFYDIIHILK